MALSKRERRNKVRSRVRSKLSGTPVRPRLSVFRSNKEIYAQVIDDLSGHTLVSASSLDADIDKEGTRKEQSRRVGKLLAQRAKAENVETVIFDRSGYRYHGRVRELAEGAREEGLIF